MTIAPNTLYEPRALWDVLRLSNEAGQPLQGLFNKENLRNASPYPIEIRHICVAPVGYLLDAYDGDSLLPAGNIGVYGACGNVINRAELMLSIPERQHFAQRPVNLHAFGMKAIAEPGQSYSLGYPSGLWGRYAWHIPEGRRLAMPRGASATFQMAPYVAQGGYLGAASDVPATVAFNEIGDGHDGSRAFIWNAHSRYQQVQVLADASPGSSPWPPADGLAVASGNARTAWPPESQLTFREYKAQEVSRAGYNRITGFGVAVDQRAYDDTIQADDSGLASNPVGALGHRIPTRARADYGTQAWWWREGAPLSLVSPSQGPALVYDLPVPIVLQPRDCFELELRIPEAPLSGQTAQPSIFQVGVSFCGYAEIRG